MGSLDRFSPVARGWFSSAFDAPTPAQEQGWAAIAGGDHTLILAPTGSGKTLAAFLWTLDRLVREPAEERCRVLYVSPLKALTYDVERNLRAPLAGMALEAGRLGLPAPTVRVGTRTGDTPAAERRDLARHPPDILITTPESLYLLLTSAARELLRSVEHVIVDEIHSVAGTKRGAHLALSLERLERLTARSPQRIGLSATQRPLDEVARFLGGRSEGRPRPVTVVDAGVRKALEIEVVVPVEDMSELGRPIVDGGGEVLSGPAAGDPEARHSIWPAMHPVLLDLVRAHRSTLIFVNSRRLAERLAARLNELAGEDLVRAHHGSVAREQRLEIEDALKAGTLPALVATSSLELGIDMGAIDLVVQVESPASVASGLQRIGRAGHGVGEPSRGRIFPKFRGDLVEAAVVVQRMKAGLIEETRVPRNPLDVLAQQIVAMCAVEDLTVEEVAEVVAGAYPFADCSAALLENTLDMLSGRYPSDDFAELRPRIVWDRPAGTLRARAGARMLAVVSGGTIPDRGLYGVYTPGPDGPGGRGGTRVGELDEEMVYESRVGETFLLGATTWRIEEITRDRVIVTPAPGQPGKMPFWHGDGLGRPAELGRAIGAFLRQVDGWPDEKLASDSCLDPLALRNLRAYLAEEREATGGALPTDRQVVVERFRDELGDWRICVLSPLGGRVHAPWALAIEARVRARLGVEVQTMWSDEGIVVRLPEADESPPVDSVLLEPEEVEELVVGELANSALFAARFRENAARALLLPRRRPGSRTPLWQQRQRAADLLAVASRHGDFPIVLETYRECLRDVFDLPALVELMSAVRARTVRVVSVDTPSPSPFAQSLAFQYVANFLYEGDAPLAERRAQALTLDRDMLAELLGAEELRELIQPDALDALEGDLQALDERRWARNADEAHDLLRRLGDLTAAELKARSVADFGPDLVAHRRAVEIRVAGEPRLIAAADAGRYRDALGAHPPPGLPEVFLAPVGDALGSLLGRYARTHGPFGSEAPAARFGLPVGVAEALLSARADAGLLLRGEFRPAAWLAERGLAHGREWCDPDVLRSLRQRSLAALRREVEPVDAAALGGFLPAWQGVGGDGRGLDRLYEVVRQLQGVAVPASVLERDVLPARVADYSPRLLDELTAAGEVVWVGAGPLGRDDGRVMLFLRATAPRLRPLDGGGGERPGGAEHDRLRAILGRRGACFFRELAGTDDKAALDALWDLVWAGEVTNDSFAALRAFAGGGGRGGAHRRTGGRPRPGSLTALGPPRAQGRWTLVDSDLAGEEVTPTERSHALAAALLDRHGVLTREAVRGEGHPGGFAAVYPVLRAMEEAGRCRRGYFVAGLGGAQFALPGAVDRLRADRRGPAAAPLVLAATDPANAYGLSLPWPERPGAGGTAERPGAGTWPERPGAGTWPERPGAGTWPERPGAGTWPERPGAGARRAGPRRVAGAYVVMIDGSPCLYVERGSRGLMALRALDGTWEHEAVVALTGLVTAGRARRLQVERYDEGLEPALKEAGFVASPKGMVRYG